MKKLKEWLRLKFRNWLNYEEDINKLEDYLSKRCDVMDVRTNHNRNVHDTLINSNHDKILANKRTLESLVQIGADVVQPNTCERSWAVICLGGKIQQVRFVDFEKKDYRYLIDFLKQFESGRRVIDAPNRDMFNDFFVWKE